MAARIRFASAVIVFHMLVTNLFSNKASSFRIQLATRTKHFQRKRNSLFLSMSNSSHNNSPSTERGPAQKRVFCYGDSLTAGTANFGLHPYGPHLERALNEIESSSSSSSISNLPTQYVVRWRGLPGWTASNMVQCLDDGNAGLRAAVQSIRNPSLSLVIILAGTNDLGMLTSNMSNHDDDVPIDAGEAVQPIVSLHKACLECPVIDDIEGTKDGKNSINTLAVGIPGSAWQEMSPKASKLARDMNLQLQTFSSSYPGGRISYVDFPFAYQRGDEKWSDDGLHLSPSGYEVMGKELAVSVKRILDGINSI